MFKDILGEKVCFSRWPERRTVTIFREKTLPRTYFSVFDNEYLTLQSSNSKNLKTGFISYYLVT